MKYFKLRIITHLCILILLCVFSKLSFANEVPEERNIYVFAPFYFDFGDQGEKALFELIHYCHNYEYYEQVEEIRPSPSPVNTSLTKLITQLEKDHNKWGIILIDSHGAPGWLAVEAYSDEDMRDNKIDEYIASGISDADIDPAFASGCYIIIISANYIRNYTSRMGNKSIVFGNFCHSDSFWNAFIDGGKVYNYFGFDRAVTLSEALYCASTLFQRLGGEIDQKRNYTVKEAMVGMPSYFHHRPKNSNAEKQVVYNSPKILQLILIENGKTIYDYSYSDFTYPFLDDPYPNATGYLGSCRKNPAGPGNITIKIRFSETMDRDPAQISVKYDPQGEFVGASPVSFSGGSWLRTYYDKDTWQSSSSIPSGGGDQYDGLATIIVRARDAFQKDASSTNPDGELDTDGDGKWNGLDTMHQFHIITQPIIIQHSALPGVPANLDLNITAGVLQTQGGSISSVSLYYRNVHNGFWYTKVKMDTTDGMTFSGVIPSEKISADQGLEYYIFVEDNYGNTCSWPEGTVIEDPFLYSGPGQKVTVHTASNGGIIVQGDEDTTNDSVDISFYLVQDTDVNIELHRATDNWLYWEGSDSPNNAYDTIGWYWVTGGGGPGQKYTVTWGNGCEFIGNYFYILRDANSGEKIAQGRLAVLFPLLTVEAYSTQSGDYDQVSINAEASGYDEGLLSASAFQDNSLYKAYNQRGSGPSYTISSIPRQGKDHQYRAGVYVSSWGEQVLIGMSDVESINAKNAPIIYPSSVPSPQTHNHPIDVSAKVTDNSWVTEVFLIYKGVGDNDWTSARMSKPRTDSDVYSAQIDSQTIAGTVYYYFQATDDERNTSTSPWYNPKGKPYSFNIIIDNVPPAITETKPENGVTGVNLEIDVKVTFSEDVRSGTVNENNIKVRDANGNEIKISSVYYDKNQKQSRFNLKGLMPLTTYFCEITSGVLDRSGNPLGEGRVPNPWWFVTKEVPPPAITEVSPITPENFLTTTEKMTFSSKFSRPVSEVKIIFKNTSTEEEFTVTDSTPILTSREDRYSYSYAWNGKDDRGQYLPDGEYKFRIEATGAKYGVVGSSEFQPFNWLAKADGTITYDKIASVRIHNDMAFTPNFSQGLSVKYHYHKVHLFRRRYRLCIDGEEHLIGSDFGVAFGEKGTWPFFVSKDAKCEIKGYGDSIGSYDDDDYAKVEYRRRYVDLEEEVSKKLYSSDNFESGEMVVHKGQELTVDFSITLVARRLTHAGPGYSYTYYEDPEEERIGGPVEGFWEGRYAYGVSLSNVHIVIPKEKKDYDDNPGITTEVVDSWIESNLGSEVTIAGIIRGRNVSPDINPFIVDRVPPTIKASVSASAFSPRLNQELGITYTITDNLPYLLKDVSLKIYDEDNSLVTTLYESSSESLGTKNFSWDGKGSDVYNGEEIVSDGTYTYVVQAKDGAGNPNSFSDTVIVDTIPPEICNGSLLIIPANHPHPETFTTNDDAIQMTFSLSDNISSSVNVEMVIESTSFGVLVSQEKTYGVTATLQSISEEWDGKDDRGNYLPDGTYKIALTATDLAGNRSEELILPSFRIDRTPSVATTLYVDHPIFTPDDGSSNQGDGYQDSVTLHYILSEEALVSVRVEDVLGRSILNLEEGSNFRTEGAHLWDGEVSGNFVSDGSYIFRIKTTDDVGNIAYDNIAIIKNQIPAQIVFPFEDTVPAKVSGLVTIKGIALDPGINNPADFKWYKVWFREGKDIDFSLPENDPQNPAPGLWHPVPVPAYNQNALDPDYPNSNISWRAVAYTTLVTLDTMGLTQESYYTLLLITEDEDGNSSYDFVTVEVDQNIDNTAPQVSITHPSELSEFRIVSDTSTLSIIYDLAQDSGKQADVSLEIFNMSDDGTGYGPIVHHRDYFSKSEGGTIAWDGKNNLRQYVENGRYRTRLIARDRDGLGGSVAEVDIMVKVIVTEPLKIMKFAASDSVIKVGDTVEIMCELSKEALVTVTIYDALDNLVETLVDSVVTPGEVEQSVTWGSQLEGLYTCKIDAIATDAGKTRDEASLSIAVTGAGAGTGIAEITSPADGSIVQGFSNFNWGASAQGEHYPPQSFSAQVQAYGEQTWRQSSRRDFNAGIKTNVAVTTDGDVTLANYTKVEERRWVGGKVRHMNFHFGNVYNILDGNPNTYVRASEGIKPWESWLTHDFGQTILLKKIRVIWYCRADDRRLDRNLLQFRTADGWYHIWNDIELPHPQGQHDRTYNINKEIGAIHWFQDNNRSYDFYAKELQSFYEVTLHPYYTSGSIISQPYYVGPSSTFGAITWTGGVASATSLKFQIATDNDNSTWIFKGPDGRRDTYYTSSGQNIWSGHNGDIYIRWKAYLSTTNEWVTPTLREVRIKANWSDEVVLNSDNPAHWETIPFNCYYNHPIHSLDLSTFLPVPSGTNIVRVEPYYSIVSESNSQVAKSITDENTYYQLKAMTDVKEDWSTEEDQGLSEGRIVSINNEFNNSRNPENFITESSPITISTGYPNVNMWVADEVKNKYTFWRDGEDSLIDNPYVSVNTKSWNIHLSYPEGTENIDLIANKQADKPSNTNTTALDDDFTVKLSSNAAPKVFVELKGNTSTLVEGFKGYSLFYKKPDEVTWKSIRSASKSPVINSGMLGWWDVTGLNGEYVVKLVVLDDSGSNEVTKNVIIGTKVPGAEATASPPNYVTSPYNKAFLSFPPDALEKETIVTITPVRLEDTDVSIDPHMPHPIGAFYKLQPKDIPFQKDSVGNVLYPASFSVRFTYEELQGIDPGQLTIYHVKDDGSLESLDVKVVYDQNGNGQFDPGEIATVTSPITSFSYYLVIPMILTPTLDQIPSPTNQKSVTLTGQAQNASLVEVFVNGASVGNADVGEDGKFSMPVSLVTGSNRITCIATRWFNDIKRTSNPSAPVEVVLDITPPEITDVYDSPDPFTPDGDGIRDNAKIFYTLSEESIVELKIYKEKSLVRTLVDSLKIESGPHSEVWDGRDDEGLPVQQGIYTYTIDATDLAGNTASQQEGQSEVSYQTMPPPAPILLAPPDEEYIDSPTPTFQIRPDESVEKQLSYGIEISTDDFRTVFRKYDQTVSTQSWTLEGEIIQYTVSQEDAFGDAIYKWRAFSYDDVQWSEPSVVWTFKLDMEPPPKPELLSPEDGASVDSPRPTFDWEDVVDTVSGLDCYEIQIDNNQDFSPPKYIAIVTVSQFIPESDLAQGEYSWRVRARDKLDHYSDWTDSWRFTRTNSPPDVPTLMSPENGKFIITKLPTFQLFSTDPDNDPLKCKIEISRDNFNTIGRYYDQNISTTGWKVVEVPSSPQGLIVQYTIQQGDELAEGIYYWRASAYDGTLWSDNSPVWNFTLDMSSPTISVASPKKGEVYNARQRMIEIEFTVADLDPNPTINAYLQNGNNVRIAVSSGERIEPLDIEDGLWNLIVESTDWAGNISSMVTGPFEITHDIRPPRTAIVVGEPKYGEQPVYVTSDTQFTLSAVDDYLTIGDGKGLGLSLTEYCVDVEKWTTYTGTFTVTLADGPHTIYYRSIDKVGLREEIKSLDIVIDNNIPQIILIVEGNLSTNGIDNFASLSCEYRLAVIGDSSWVDYTEFKVDNGDWQTYTAPFGFATAGEHMIKYRIVSKTGSPEKENVFKIFVDDTPPETTRSSSPPLYNELYASTSTIFSISGLDPLVEGKASGIAEIKYRIDEEEFITYLENFSLNGGEHTIYYYGRDNVNNVEGVNSFKVFVDTVPPHTTLTHSEPLYEEGENIFAPISCTYSLESSQDLSGVNHIKFNIDDGNWNIYNSSFSFSTEGKHLIRYKAVSNTGVWETEQKFGVIVDAKGPKVVSVYPENGAYVREPDIGVIKICFGESVEIGEKKWEKGVFISEARNGTPVHGETKYDEAKYILTFKGRFEDHTQYNIKLTSEIKDRVGNPLKEFSSSFTTLMLKDKGGKVEEGEVSLEIPPNALPQDAVIIISKEEDEIVNKIPRPLQSLEKDKLYHIVAYNQDHQEIQQKLKKPMEMKISYGKESKSQTKDSSKVEINSINPKTLKLYWYNPEKERWEMVKNSKNNFSVEEVMAQVERFGRYCLMGFIPFGDSLEGLTNYPNPFPAFGKNYTTIQYYLKDDADVAIAIYDLMGNLVRTFEIRKGGEGGTAGLNDVEWDGRNGRGDMVANGGYICRVQINDGKRVKSKIRKILVIK